MKLGAITVHQPFADDILDGRKTVENRTWSTAYRGPLLIHSGKRSQPGARHRERGALGLVMLRSVHGAGLLDCYCTPEQGAADYDTYVMDARPDRLFHLLLDTPVRVPTPVPANGRQLLWYVPDNLNARIVTETHDWQGWAEMMGDDSDE